MPARQSAPAEEISCFHIAPRRTLRVNLGHIVLPVILSRLALPAQVDVFAYEYSGYGHSTGEPSEQNLYSNARAALSLLTDGFGLKPERDIVLFGAMAPPRIPVCKCCRHRVLHCPHTPQVRSHSTGSGGVLAARRYPESQNSISTWCRVNPLDWLPTTYVSGKSLGSCPTCYLAGKHAFRGVIIVAGLASGARILFPTTKLWALDAQFFNNLGHMSTCTSPVQVRAHRIAAGAPRGGEGARPSVGVLRARLLLRNAPLAHASTAAHPR